MGACITQRPDLAAAVHCAVPLLDMVRFHRFLIARLWIPEYGDPDEPEDFAWLHAYSPYHRVVDGTCYPPVAAHDGRGGHPGRPRATPASSPPGSRRPRRAGTSTRSSLRVESRAGHGVGKPVGKQADEAADVLAFLDALSSDGNRANVRCCVWGV